jgi:hypothetical protein
VIKFLLDPVMTCPAIIATLFAASTSVLVPIVIFSIIIIIALIVLAIFARYFRL